MRAMLVVLFVAAIGLGFGFLAGMGDARFGGLSVFFLCALIAFAINWFAFVPAALMRSEKFYDLTGAATYLTMITVAAVLSAPLDARASVAALMVAAWAGRLGLFLFTRINKDGHDRRFNEIKTAPARFLVAWTLQALWTVLTAACALAIIVSPQRAPLGVFFFVGAGAWLAGFLIEVVADAQKRAFRADPENADKFINTGLWAWSRHPNYFGEIVLWTGMAVMALPVLAGGLWLALVSPVFVAFLLLKVSGVPLLEKHGREKWGDDSAYQAYLKRTPTLIPRPPKKNA